MRRLPVEAGGGAVRAAVVAAVVVAAVAGLMGAANPVRGVSVVAAAARRQRASAVAAASTAGGPDRSALAAGPSSAVSPLDIARGKGDMGNTTAARLDVLDTPSPCLYDVLLPGTHDSSSYTTTFDVVPRGAHKLLQRPWLRRLLSGPISAMSITQGGRILSQLRAGARYLDIRVGQVAGDGKTWWMIHGMVACAPFVEAVDDINTFHREGGGTVVWVIREERFAPGESARLATYLRENVQGAIYDGDQAGLRRTPFRSLPPNVIFGVSALTPIPALLAVDEWVNTYSARVKVPALLEQMTAASTRVARDTLMVIGWTLTPQPLDIVLRVVTFNVGRPSLREAAAAMNGQVYPFLDAHRRLTLDKANVIFFDWMGPSEASAVLALNSGVFIAEVLPPPTPPPVPDLASVDGVPLLPALTAATMPALPGATVRPLAPSPSSSLPSLGGGGVGGSPTPAAMVPSTVAGLPTATPQPVGPSVRVAAGGSRGLRARVVPA